MDCLIGIAELDVIILAEMTNTAICTVIREGNIVDDDPWLGASGKVWHARLARLVGREVLWRPGEPYRDLWLHLVSPQITSNGRVVEAWEVNDGGFPSCEAALSSRINTLPPGLVVRDNGRPFVGVEDIIIAAILGGGSTSALTNSAKWGHYASRRIVETLMSLWPQNWLEDDLWGDLADVLHRVVVCGPRALGCLEWFVDKWGNVLTERMDNDRVEQWYDDQLMQTLSRAMVDCRILKLVLPLAKRVRSINVNMYREVVSRVRDNYPLPGVGALEMMHAAYPQDLTNHEFVDQLLMEYIRWIPDLTRSRVIADFLRPYGKHEFLHLLHRFIETGCLVPLLDIQSDPTLLAQLQYSVDWLGVDSLEEAYWYMILTTAVAGGHWAVATRAYGELGGVIGDVAFRILNAPAAAENYALKTAIKATLAANGATADYVADNLLTAASIPLVTYNIEALDTIPRQLPSLDALEWAITLPRNLAQSGGEINFTSRSIKFLLPTLFEGNPDPSYIKAVASLLVQGSSHSLMYYPAYRVSEAMVPLLLALGVPEGQVSRGLAPYHPRAFVGG